MEGSYSCDNDLGSEEAEGMVTVRDLGRICGLLDPSNGLIELLAQSSRGNHSIQSHHFMANGETVKDFVFLGSKITVDSDCNHEIKRRLLLGRKAMINLDSLLKSF